MERKLVHGSLAIVLVSVLFGAGCSSNTSPPVAAGGSIKKASSAVGFLNASENGAATRNGIPQARVTDRPSNPDGAVFVVEYHHLGDSKDSMFRSADKFRADLQRYDRMGFRPVTVSEYLRNQMQLAPGASPLVVTFDDANPDQVKLLPDGKLAPDCFLGIWQEFARTHPEFPIRATFFVLPTMWGQHSLLDKKLSLLKSLGCELGNHTITHPILRKLPDAKVKWEVGEAELRLAKLGVPIPAPLALPFGSSPKNKDLLRGFDYEGTHIAPPGVFLVGAGPARVTTSKKFDHLRIPRIQAYDGPFGIKFWLDEVQKGKVKLYVQ